MTQLRTLLEYFREAPRFRGQDRSYHYFKAIVGYSESNDSYCAQVIADILSLDDSIVCGLNTGVFSFESTVFSRRGTSRLPKFLFGLLLCVFDKEGNLRDNYCAISVQTLLEGLRIVRRMPLASMKKQSKVAAVNKFIAAQRKDRFFQPEVVEALSDYWKVIEDQIFNLGLFILGSPGNGVTSDMVFPWVPQFQLPDPRTLPFGSLAQGFLLRCVSDKTGLIDGAPVVPGSDLIRFWSFRPTRVVSLVTVPKSAIIDRPITVTDTFSAGLGASFRESTLLAAKSLGLSRLLNIKDQSLSRSRLRDSFDSVFCFDAADGSTCISNKVCDLLLQRAPVLKDLIRNSRPHYVKIDQTPLIPVTTVTMGDSFAVSVLSLTMLFSAIYADYLSRKCLPVGSRLSRREVLESIELAIEDDIIRVVGDDLIFKRSTLPHTLPTLSCIGIECNFRKSSFPLGNHQESCGSWFVRNPIDGSIVELAPYRLFSTDSDIAIESMSLSEYLRRLYDVRSRNLFAVAIAIQRTYPHLSRTLQYESYVSTELGSVVGHTPCRQSFHKRNGRLTQVDDTLSFLFGFGTRGISPRMSKRPLRTRYRLRRIPGHSGVGPFRANNRCEDRCSTDHPHQPEIPLTYHDTLVYTNMITSWSYAHKQRTAYVLSLLET